MGGLPYMTPLRITWGAHSAIAYKRDIGLGGGPIGGLPRVIDLWWELAGRLGVPYEHGLWSGPVEIERPPSTGAASLLGQDPAGRPSPTTSASECGGASSAGLPLTPGPRATLLPNGLAAAPAGAPAAVKGIIAAGNEIVGKPYVYGGGHGLPLSQIAPAYDCSSSVVAPALGWRAAAGDRRRDLGRARVLRAARTRPVGHDLRERRARVRVCGRAQVGHAQRRRTG